MAVRLTLGRGCAHAARCLPSRARAGAAVCSEARPRTSRRGLATGRTARTAVPFVIERSGRMERSYDIYSRLLKDRIVCLNGPINDMVSNVIMAQLLFLESESRDLPISMYINSPGGSVTSGLAIYDTMQYIKPEITTLCVGQCASMGSLLLAAGTKGRRYSLPNARVMLHQPSGGAQGQASDIVIHAHEIIALKTRLNEIYEHHTGQPMNTIVRILDRDRFFSAQQALEFGLIDRVITSRDATEVAGEAGTEGANGTPGAPKDK